MRHEAAIEGSAERETGIGVEQLHVGRVPTLVELDDVGDLGVELLGGKSGDVELRGRGPRRAGAIGNWRRCPTVVAPASTIVPRTGMTSSAVG